VSIITEALKRAEQERVLHMSKPFIEKRPVSAFAQASEADILIKKLFHPRFGEIESAPLEAVGQIRNFSEWRSAIFFSIFFMFLAGALYLLVSWPVIGQNDSVNWNPFQSGTNTISSRFVNAYRGPTGVSARETSDPMKGDLGVRLASYELPQVELDLPVTASEEVPSLEIVSSAELNVQREPNLADVPLHSRAHAQPLNQMVSTAVADPVFVNQAVPQQYAFQPAPYVQSTNMPYLLSGISVSEDDRYAVVNGQIVTEGDLVDGAYVKQILERDVVLDTKTSEIKLKLPS
jgi:hypothetical protein